MALVFVHRQLHEGAPVWEGRKYVLRSGPAIGTAMRAQYVVSWAFIHGNFTLTR